MSGLEVVGRGLGLIEYAVICLEIVKFGEELGETVSWLLAIAAAMVTMRRRRVEGDRRQLAKWIWAHRWTSCWVVSGCRPGPPGGPAVTQKVAAAVGAKGSGNGVAVIAAVRRGGNRAISAARPGLWGKGKRWPSREDRSASCGRSDQDVMVCSHQHQGHGVLRLEEGQRKGINVFPIHPPEVTQDTAGIVPVQRVA